MIRSICNKTLWLEHSVINKIGVPDAVVDAYQSCTTARARAP